MAVETRKTEKIAKPLSLQTQETSGPLVTGVTTTGKLVVEGLSCFGDFCMPAKECYFHPNPNWCPAKVDILLPIKDSTDLLVTCPLGRTVRILTPNLQMALYGQPTGDGSPSPYFLIQREKASQRTNH